MRLVAPLKCHICGFESGDTGCQFILTRDCEILCPMCLEETLKQFHSLAKGLNEMNFATLEITANSMVRVFK